MPKGGNDIEMPPHAYIPGQTARHPEDWFDQIKETVSADIPPDRLHQTSAWKSGLAYLEAGYFWECHEVLEAVWMQAPVGSSEREMVQAVIQLANARLKLLMGKPRAVARLCEMVRAHLDRCPPQREVLGLRAQDLYVQLSATMAEISK